MAFQRKLIPRVNKSDLHVQEQLSMLICWFICSAQNHTERPDHCQLATSAGVQDKGLFYTPTSSVARAGDLSSASSC